MRIFELNQEMNLLLNLMESDCESDPITGEVTDNSETLKNMFNELTLKFSDKLDSCAYVLNILESDSELLKKEAKRLNERSKNIDKNINTLKELMLSALLNIEGNKLKTTKFTFGTRKSESVQIEEDFNMQGKYVRVKETREPDKTAIKEAIKAGETVLGVSLVTNKSLSIR